MIMLKWPCILEKNDDLILFHFMDSHRENLFYSYQYHKDCLAASDLFHMLHNQLSSKDSIITH